MNILLIGNPISSGGQAGRRIEGLCNLLKKRGHQIKTYLTQYAGDGKIHIQALSKGMDRIVVIGGDGTLNEIINGFDATPACPILHYPTGNANLLAKDLKLPNNLSQVANLLENGKTVFADTGTMNQSRFIMVCGMGFDARVTEELKKVRKGTVSNFSYVRPFIRALKTSTKKQLLVHIDDGEFEASGMAVLVSNVRNYGGICDMAYHANIANGKLDVLVFPSDTLISLLTCLFMAMFSRITHVKGVTYLKAQKRVLVQSEDPIPVELDGDFFERHNPVDIRVQPGTIPLIVPAL